MGKTYRHQNNSRYSDGPRGRTKDNRDRKAKKEKIKSSRTLNEVEYDDDNFDDYVSFSDEIIINKYSDES